MLSLCCPQQRLRWRTKAVNALAVAALSLSPGRSQGFVGISKAAAGLDGILLFSRSQKTGVRRSRPQPRKFTILALHPALLSSPFSGGKSAASVPERSLSGVVGPFTDYASFEQALRNLTGDPLQDSGGRIVISRGSPSAKLCIIGEAPGVCEDKLGKPFVGRSGKLLDAILQSVGFNNEKDVSMEVLYYEKWLCEEIRCGAAAHLCISKVRGQWYEVEYGGRKRHVMPVFHPSYLLRNPTTAKNGPKYLTWNDMKNVRKKYMDDGCGVEVEDSSKR